MIKLAIPAFRKGDLVKPLGGVGGVLGWRKATHEEREAWYAKHREEVRAGRAQPYDDAGESVLAPPDTQVMIPADAVLTVVRGRVNAQSGYHKIKDCCQVFCPQNGETLYIRRWTVTRDW